MCSSDLSYSQLPNGKTPTDLLPVYKALHGVFRAVYDASRDSQQAYAERLKAENAVAGGGTSTAVSTGDSDTIDFSESM